ncbi:MAG: capsule biosynthesis protein [Gammaproteobacteria bacterium]|nr:capsule biosynthesis protein [Gammaproteobacteria bacterium]
MKFLRKKVKRWFIDHPASVNESYWQHCLAALGFSAALLRASTACLVHALIPVCFTTAASRRVDELHRRMFVARGTADMSAAESQGRE